MSLKINEIALILKFKAIFEQLRMGAVWEGSKEMAGKNSKSGYRGLSEDEFYFNEQGFIVFTAKYHLKRGYCCKSGCKHCPYGFQDQKK